ncbi:DUF4129 domain-containing protein [Paenarthrobacter aurescens]|uniref:Protein-glutamine gamma-glutamyltransferase-like C-terminal domain-containing protein n=1 Tax=Paenarthrobacter aurescens TaxID=43663 RepID=A0A4Y3N912_PAEAU|nr:DUF4129 domain-containing protein [Paenarthrobacter aurescens]MDO6144122.1 DUF4129 domain-containing protein [Paenarthrobacter aurescens]MDO6147969.1 DUF4129 domain-containing protein [Paenarthrobacter aurescens]MDO6159213.1 DUF4129 domain-containing protein [Paenarthrobacter aurescens]MDO6163197.1 DUF4129 domain-containing protein [Paenarthrobacter aurescens]GEB18320.1 hypothetical protein AAU01_10750 [Paenarthrobacter aurescens]
MTPDRDEARRWAIEELSNPRYPDATPGWLEQIWRDFMDWLSSLDGGSGTGPDLAVPLLVVLALALIIAAIVFVRPRLNARRSKEAADLYGEDTSIDAEGYRARAATAADGGNWPSAVVDQFRALVRSAEEKDIIDVRAGRTADEAAAQLGGVFGTAQVKLMAAAGIFDAVRYGEHPATRTDYESVRRLDAELLELKPDFAARTSAGFAVPQ